MDGAPDLGLATLAATLLAATVCWAFLQHARTRPRRPSRGPVTLDLGDEPPAIVDLLTDNFTVTPQAVAATLVDLAARRWLSIEQYGDRAVIRTTSKTGDGELLPFERRVLDHVRSLAVDGVVPTEVMTTGARGASKSWWRGFRHEVNSEAQRRGWCRDRWSKAMLTPLWVGVLGTGGLLWLSDRRNDGSGEVRLDDPAGALFALTVVALVGFVVWLVALQQRDLQRDTDAGLDVAARWLGVREFMATVGQFEDKPAASVALWDRHLAHAVALDLAPQVVRELPLGAEDHRQAWSRVSGQWRPVEVHYPLFRPSYGRHPAMAVASGLFVGGLGVAALVLAGRVMAGRIGVIEDMPDDGQRIADRVALVVAGVALVIVAWNALRLLAGLSGLFNTETVEGVVLRKRGRYGWIGLTDEPARSSSGDVETRYYLAVDTGASTVVHAWIVRRQIFDQAAQGQYVRVRVARPLGYVRSLEVVGEPRDRTE